MPEDYLIQEFHEAGIYLEEEIERAEKLAREIYIQQFRSQPHIQHAMFGPLGQIVKVIGSIAGGGIGSILR